MAGIKIVDLPAVGRDLAATDLFEMSLAGGTGSRKITGQEIMNASKLSVNNTPVINGTAGRIFFQGSTNVLQQSSSLFWDGTNNRLGIGTSSPTNIVSIATNTNATEGIFLTNTSTGNLARTIFRLTNNSGNVGQLSIWGSGTGLANKTFFEATKDFVIGTDADTASGGTSRFQVYTGGFNNATSPQFTIFGTGNVGINTTTDAGFRLDVNGTARVTGGVTSGVALVGTWSVSASYARFGHNLFNGGTTFGFLQQQNGDCFINGLSNFISASTNNIFETNGAERMRITSSGNVLIGTTTDDGFRLDVNGTARTSTLTVNNGFTLNSGGASPNSHYLTMTSGSATASTLQFRGVNTNSTLTFSLWNFQIIDNNSTGETRFFIGGGSCFPTFYSNGVERMRLSAGGNMLINTTTDAGFRLDVNGTARVSAADGLSAFQITAPTRAWYFTTSQQGGTFNAISGSANGVAGSGNYGFVLSGGWAFNIGNDNVQPNSFFSVRPAGLNQGEVRIGGQTGNGSSLLTLESSTKGFLPPRMTQTQRNAIASPAIGLEIYQTDATEGKYIYKSSGWTYIG